MSQNATPIPRADTLTADEKYRTPPRTIVLFTLLLATAAIYFFYLPDVI